MTDELDDLDDFDADILNDFFFHAHAEGNWEEIRSAIAEDGLLADQAERGQGFAKCTADLEEHILPAALESQAWDCFLQYALTAVNLRGIAESLADEEVLSALVRRKRWTFADNLVAQLPEQERRAWAQAVIASAADGPERAERVRQVREELSGLLPTLPEERARRQELLAGIARHLGPELLADWKDLARRELDGSQARARLWLEVARSCLRAGGADHPGFHMALREIGDLAILTAELPALWREHGPVDLQAARDLTRKIGDPAGHLFWSLALPQLGRAAQVDPAGALDAWRREVAAGPAVPWSVELVEAGSEILGRLPEEGAERIAAGLADPATRAALFVLRLQQSPDLGRARAALAAVEALTEPEGRLHWALRALLSWPTSVASERAGLTASVVRYLADHRYAAPAGDLALFLDLVSAVFSRELPRQVENVIWAPASTPATLLALVEEAQDSKVLRLLLTNAEPFAAVVGPTEAEAFELRARVLTRVACRLALREETLGSVEEASRRLLSEEQDELYATTARALANASKTDETTRAPELAQRIRSRRLGLATRLAVAAGEELEPVRLYAAAASNETLADERLALGALAEPALDAERLLERHLVPMRSKERQARALVDLAHHALAFELAFYRSGQQDPLAPLQLLRSSLTGTGSDERLLALALELVELARPLPARRALAELHAAIDAVFALGEISWPRRIEAVESLAARLGPILLGDLPPGSHRARSRGRSAAAFLESLAELPFRAGVLTDPDGLRRHWPEVPPILAAAAERLPATARGRWMSKLVRPWDGLAPAETEILELCDTRPEERIRAARTLLAAPASDPARVQALCYLLASAAPELVPELAGLLPRGSLRDRLCARLVRNGWLPAGPARRLLSLMADPVARRRAAVEHSAAPDAEWLQDLAALAAAGEVDPDDPTLWPLLRRLWKTGTGLERQALGTAVLTALPREGRRAGEDALCIWLNAHLAPRIGGEVQDREERDARIREALAGSLTLAPG